MSSILERIDLSLKQVMALCKNAGPEHEMQADIDAIYAVAQDAHRELKHHPGLTVRQAECKVRIAAFIDEKGYSPSMVEIARMMGLRSPGYACRMVKMLVERGHLRHLPRQSRSLEVV